MKYIDYDKLPVEVKDNELPREDGMDYKMFYDYSKRTNGGFADAMFLGALIATSFLWGMLVVLFRG